MSHTDADTKVIIEALGIPRVARVLSQYGQRGDTELAHINKREKAMLKARGGSGRVNPKTKLRGYDDWGFGGEGSFSDSFGSNFGEGGDFNSGGFTSSDYGSWGGTAGYGGAPQSDEQGRSLGVGPGGALGYRDENTGQFFAAPTTAENPDPGPNRDIFGFETPSSPLGPSDPGDNRTIGPTDDGSGLAGIGYLGWSSGPGIGPGESGNPSSPAFVGPAQANPFQEFKANLASPLSFLKSKTGEVMDDFQNNPAKWVANLGLTALALAVPPTAALGPAISTMSNLNAIGGMTGLGTVGDVAQNLANTQAARGTASAPSQAGGSGMAPAGGFTGDIAGGDGGPELAFLDDEQEQMPALPQDMISPPSSIGLPSGFPGGVGASTVRPLERPLIAPRASQYSGRPSSYATLPDILRVLRLQA